MAASSDRGAAVMDRRESRLTPKQLIEATRGVLAAVRNGDGPAAASTIKYRMILQFDGFERVVEGEYPEKSDIETPDYKALHTELIMAVVRRYPGETRHQTALRYIQQAEAPKHDDNRAAQS